MFSTVKIENGVILDGKKLKCVKSYRLEQKERLYRRTYSKYGCSGFL